MITKKRKIINEQLPKTSQSLDNAIQFIKKFSSEKFDETVEISVNLGVDVQQSDQVVKGFVYLPHGTGKKVKIAVVTKNEKFEEAKLAGADVVGSESLIEDMGKGNLDYDVIVATPDMMTELSKIGRILGPRKLMPNPKLGTVTDDISSVVKSIKSGKANFCTDKGGIVHAGIGKISFSDQFLKENIIAFVSALAKAKPAAAKGVFICKVHLSSTMGPSVSLVVSELLG